MPAPIPLPFTGLTHLELNEVTGLDNSVMAALQPLTSLLHLSITCIETQGVTNAALASLSGVAALRHLEWAVGDGLSAQALQAPGGGCDTLSRIGTLRFLSLFVSEDVNERAEEEERGPRGAGAGSLGLQRNTNAISSLYDDGGQKRAPGVGVGVAGSLRGMALNREVGWRALLQSALPLCHVTHLPAMSKYSVWDDSTWVM